MISEAKEFNISVKTLEVCSLMNETNDLWFLNMFTDRDYSIRESDKVCPECGYNLVAVDEFEIYCNNCGKLFKTIDTWKYKSYKPFGYDMKSLKSHSLNLKNRDKDLIKMNKDNNKGYRNFKHRYYNLFITIATNEYNIDKKDANDLFYLYFRGYYDLNNKRGLKRQKLIRRFLDKININPRDYFIQGVGYYNKDKDVYIIDSNGNRKLPEGGSRLPKVAEGQLNVTDKDFTGRRLSYQQFLKVNNYPNTSAIMFKYIKRYCHDYTLLNPNPVIIKNNKSKSVAKPITPVPTLSNLNPEDITIPVALNNYYKPKHFHTCAYCGSKMSKPALFCNALCRDLFYTTINDLPIPITWDLTVFQVGTFTTGVLYNKPIKENNHNPDQETYKCLGKEEYYTQLNYQNNAR